MPFNIKDFKSSLTNGGARSYLFEVQIDFPDAVKQKISPLAAASGILDFSRQLSVQCKSASLPASTIGEITIPYQGRSVFCVGNRTFEPWSITVINDEDFILRRAFEFWMNAMNGHNSNSKRFGVTSVPSTYQVDAIVRQYSQGANTAPIRTYKFINTFPTAVSFIELDWGTTDSIEEFSVTLRYDYWEEQIDS